MNNNPHQPDTDDVVLSGKSSSPILLPTCPVCKTEYIEGEVNRCFICNWDLTPCPKALMEKHNAQLAWAREMWMKFQVQEKQLHASQFQVEEVEQEKARFEGEVLYRLNQLEKVQDSSKAVIWAEVPQDTSKADELEKQLLKIHKKLSEADQERQKLKIKISELSVQTAKLEAEQQKKTTDDPQLISELGIDYSRLRNFLARGEWEKANDETNFIINAIYRLLPDEKSINRFPCSDLCTIDEVWVRYSYGKFGFSVQNLIYEEEGEDYNSLALAVGWKGWDHKAEKSLMEKGRIYTGDQKQLNFSLSAPVGHLPFLASDLSFDCYYDWYSQLAFRKVQCIILKIQAVCQSNKKNELNNPTKHSFEISSEILKKYKGYYYRHADKIETEKCIPIEELQLSVRAYNCLKRAKIHSVDALFLSFMREAEFLETSNFKARLAEEVNQALLQQNLEIALYLEQVLNISAIE